MTTQTILTIVAACMLVVIISIQSINARILRRKFENQRRVAEVYQRECELWRKMHPELEGAVETELLRLPLYGRAK